MLDSFLDRPWPNEAKVAVSWFDWLLSVQPGESGSMDIQLPITEAVVTEPFVLLVNFSTKYIAIEGVRALPVGDGDHAVVNNDARQHLPDAVRPRASRVEQANGTRPGPA